MKHTQPILWLMSQFLAAFLGVFLTSCSSKVSTGALIKPSSSGKLSRFDLMSSDVLPASNFVASYGTSDQLLALFFKTFTPGSPNGYQLETLNLFYKGDRVDSVASSALTNQKLIYSGSAEGLSERLFELRYNTVRDTGAIRFTYDFTQAPSGRPVFYQDSLKVLNKPPVRNRFDITYDGLGNAVRRSQSRVNNGGVLRLDYIEDFTFDDKPNPFRGLPPLRNFSLLEGSFNLLYNVNNIATYTRKQLVFTDGVGGARNEFPDTVLLYRSAREYNYDVNGKPIRFTERFTDYFTNTSGSYRYVLSY